MHPTPKSAHATMVAVDLAKDVFGRAFSDNDARIVDRRRLPRAAFAAAFENRAPLRIVMEACSSAHNRARRFPPRVAPSETSMANESVPGTSKPITLLACVAD